DRREEIQPGVRDLDPAARRLLLQEFLIGHCGGCTVRQADVQALGADRDQANRQDWQETSKSHGRVPIVKRNGTCRQMFLIRPTFGVERGRMTIPNFTDERRLICPGHLPAFLNTHWTPAVFPCPARIGEIGAAPARVTPPSFSLPESGWPR